MTQLSSIHAHHLTVFQSCSFSRRKGDKVSIALESFKKRKGAEKTQTEVKRLIHEINPQLIDFSKKMSRISKIYYALTGLRSLKDFFE